MKRKLLLMAVLAATLVGGRAQAQTSKPSDDGSLRQRLVGMWKREGKPNRTNTVTATVAFRADGTYSNHVSSVVWPSSSSGYTTGTWRIEEGVIVRTVRARSGADAPAVGTETSWTIERLDDRQLTVKDRRGITTQYRRSK
jgi:hypothetical protein